MHVIVNWISVVAGQNAAAWWAAKQNGPHPDLCRQIKYAIDQRPSEFSPIIRKAWRYILEGRRFNEDNSFRNILHLSKRSRLTVGPKIVSVSFRNFIARLSGPEWSHKTLLAPDASTELRLTDIGEAEMFEYPGHNEKLSVPTTYLPLLLKGLRQNLELAVALELEIGGYSLKFLDPIKSEQADATKPRSGISQPISTFVDYFKELLHDNPSAARSELQAWHANNDEAFALLKIWASGDKRLMSSTEVTHFFRAH